VSTGPEQPPRGPQHSAIAAAEPNAMASARNAFRKGSIGGILTRINGRPVMLIMRADFKGRTFGIPKDRIGLYVDEKLGAARPALVAKAQEIVKHIGVDPLNTNINDVIDMVLFQAPDLLKMEFGQ